MRISDWSSDVCSSDLGFLRQAFDDGHHAPDFLLGGNIVRARSRRLAADVEHVGALPRQPQAVRDRGLDRGVFAAIGKRIRGHIDDAKHPRPIELEDAAGAVELRSEEHTSELQSLMRNSYAVFCL